MNFWSSFGNGMKNFGQTISSIVNLVLLLFVYVFGIGLTSIIAKISGKVFLDTKKAKSYWTTLDEKKHPQEEYLRQF